MIRLRTFRPAAQYALVSTLVAATTVVRLPFERWLEGHAPFGLYFPIIVAVALCWGVRATILASVLSLAAAEFFIMQPRFSFALPGAADRAAVILFVVAASSLVVLARWAAKTRQNVEQLAGIVSFSDDAIVRKNVDGIVQTWNPAAERIFGYRPEEIIGRPIWLIIPTDRRQEEETILARIRRGERIEHYETIRVTKDGRLLDISLTISPIRDSSGTVVGAAKVARDISERKAAARALAEQQAWFRVTLGSIGDAVITADRDGRVTFLNRSAERLTGRSATEAHGQRLPDVFRAINQRTGQHLDDPLSPLSGHAGSLPVTDHITLLAHDGLEHPIELSVAPIVDDQKGTIGSVLVFQDVAERRRAADALAEQREWLQTTLESIADAVIATDIEGRVVFMNRIAEQLSGWRARDARGRDCADVFRIVDGVSRATVENPVSQVLRDGTTGRLATQTVLVGRDGREFPIDDSASPIRNREGRAVGVVLVFHDVTERRRAEKERQLADGEREYFLQSERAARSEAERANRVKDDFVATLSHELRTPLNAIVGWTQLLRRKGPAFDRETVERGLSVIERNTQLQIQLISDLLDVSRITAGKIRLDIQIVDLAATVEAAIDAAKPMADGKAIVIERKIADRVGPVAGDPTRLQQIVSNLLTNAIKFTGQGGNVAVAVEDDGTHATITVTDNGIGIKPELLPLLFDRFRQGDSSTTRRHGGLGLGLTIVKQLVKLHGGEIAVESSGEGQGATFTVSLPAGLFQTRAADTDDVRERASGPPEMRIEGIRLLVVEDEPDTRELIQRILAEAGGKVVAVPSASAALAALRAEPWDILVSDIGLPDEDGYSLVEKVRGLPPSEGGLIPAIAVTAFARSDDRTRALRAGFQSHVAKPVEPGELLASIASFARVVRAPSGTRSVS
jgi:PAS domain S-box-containing protein